MASSSVAMKLRLWAAAYAHGIPHKVIAPTSTLNRPGDRVKIDRRDGHQLASLYAHGLLTPPGAPDPDFGD